jgi:hypothetical protein
LRLWHVARGQKWCARESAMLGGNIALLGSLEMMRVEQLAVRPDTDATTTRVVAE